MFLCHVSLYAQFSIGKKEMLVEGQLALKTLVEIVAVRNGKAVSKT